MKHPLCKLLFVVMAGHVVADSSSAGSDARPATPASLEVVRDQVQALFRSASISFALSFDRPPVHVSTDSGGVTLVLGGEEPGRVLRLNSSGALQWQHDVTRKYSTPFPPDFTPADDGTVMLGYAVADGAPSYFSRDPPQGAARLLGEEGEGEAGRYLVLRPDGSVAVDDTLGISKDLSPDGQYYYSVYQEGHEIVLKRISGNKWRIGIPPPEHREAAAKPDLIVGFVGKSRVMVSERMPGGRRTGLIDLLSQGALWTELEFPPASRPACFDRLQAGIDRRGNLLYADRPDSAVEHSQVFAFDLDGKLLWSQDMKGPAVSGASCWVICSTGQDLAALITGADLGIIDTRTGRLLDAHSIDASFWWMFEGSFEGSRLNLAGQSLGHKGPCLIQAAVGRDGKITSLEEHRVLIRGLARRAMSCIVTHGDSTQPWIVAGFKK